MREEERVFSGLIAAITLLIAIAEGPDGAKNSTNVATAS
jgi:hypothetical protein